MKKDNEEKKIVNEICDCSTGEIISLYEGDQFRIIRSEQKEAIRLSKENKKLNKEIKDWNNSLGGFIFVLFKYGYKLLDDYPELISEDITKLFYLATYVNYDGYIVFNDDYVMKNMLKVMLKLSRKSFEIFFNKMIKYEILICDNDKHIKINKNHFYKGEIDKDIQQYYNYSRIYINTIRYLFEHVSVRKHKQLGVYFKIIPYIHRQQNSLCWNPDSDQKDIQLMHVKELKELLGYHRNGVRKFINELLETTLESGESILGFIRTKPKEENSYIIVNPKVFYGGNFKLEGGKESITKWFIK